MPQVHSNGITLEYERSGPADGAPLLLIHGVGAQLVRWPPSLLDALAAAGFDIIRFDNRDVGLSTHMDDAGIPDFATMQAAVARGETPDLPYTLADMAADAAGLLDALGIRSRAYPRRVAWRHDCADAGDRTSGAGGVPRHRHVANRECRFTPIRSSGARRARQPGTGPARG